MYVEKLIRVFFLMFHLNRTIHELFSKNKFGTLLVYSQ